MDKSPMDIGQQVTVEAGVMNPPMINLRSSIKPSNGDFKTAMRNPVKEPAVISKYLLVYHRDNYDDAEMLAKELKSCSSCYAIKIGVTEFSEMDISNEKDWVADVEDDYKHFSGKTPFDMVVVLIPFKNGDRIYNALKELCYNKLNVSSQCVKPKTI